MQNRQGQPLPLPTVAVRRLEDESLPAAQLVHRHVLALLEPRALAAGVRPAERRREPAVREARAEDRLRRRGVEEEVAEREGGRRASEVRGDGRHRARLDFDHPPLAELVGVPRARELAARRRGRSAVQEHLAHVAMGELRLEVVHDDRRLRVGDERGEGLGTEAEAREVVDVERRQADGLHSPWLAVEGGAVRPAADHDVFVRLSGAAARDHRWEFGERPSRLGSDRRVRREEVRERHRHELQRACCKRVRLRQLAGGALARLPAAVIPPEAGHLAARRRRVAHAVNHRAHVEERVAPC